MGKRKLTEKELTYLIGAALKEMRAAGSLVAQDRVREEWRQTCGEKFARRLDRALTTRAMR